MSDWQTPDDGQSLAEIESAIRAAGNYVCPSDDLRPSTLEAAREYCQDRRVRRKFGRMLIAAVLLITFGAPIFERLDNKVKPPAAPSAMEMQRRALEHAAQASVGPNWGMLEAFTEWRRVQADRLSFK